MHSVTSQAVGFSRYPNSFIDVEYESDSDLDLSDALVGLTLEELIEAVNESLPKDGPKAIADMINGVSDEDHRLILAQMCIASNPREAAEHLARFKILNPAGRLKLANAVAEVDLNVLIAHFTQFNIENEQERLSFSKRCMNENPLQTLANLSQFSLGEASRVELAKTCIAEHRAVFQKYSRYFNLEQESSRFEVAQFSLIRCLRFSLLIFKRKGAEPSSVLRSLDVKGRSFCFRLANICLEKNLTLFLSGFDQFCVETERDRIRLAVLCMKKNATATAKYFYQFQITSVFSREALAKRYAEIVSGSVVMHIKNFDLEGDEARVFCAREGIKTDARLIAQQIDQFEIQNAEARSKILNECKENWDQYPKSREVVDPDLYSMEMRWEDVVSSSFQEEESL